MDDTKIKQKQSTSDDLLKQLKVDLKQFIDIQILSEAYRESLIKKERDDETT